MKNLTWRYPPLVPLVLGLGVLTAACTTTSRGMVSDRPVPQGIGPAPANDLLAAAVRIAGPVLDKGKEEKRNYRHELALEALLELGAVTGEGACRERVLKRAAALGLQPGTRVPWSWTPDLDVPGTPAYQSELFGCFSYALYRATDDRKWVLSFVSETERVKRVSLRSPEGASLAPRGELAGHGPTMLLDAIQEYAARMARTGAMTGDRSFNIEAARQIQLYRDLLRDPKTGLWSQGRHWLPDQPEALSPGAWSRGHGWLMRGLIASLEVLPKDSQEFVQMRNHLQELADALLPLQKPDGTWHALLHRPASESSADTSGTAMIATGLSRAWREGWLEDVKYVEAAQRSFAVLPSYVAANGDVRSASPGPGPLVSEANYLGTVFPPRNPHGTYSVLFAAAEAARLSKHVGHQLKAAAICGAPVP